MSYILGALKKADQERRRASEVKISDWDQDAWDDPTPADNTARWLIGSVVVGLILVVLVFSFVAFRVLEAVPPRYSVDTADETSSDGVPEEVLSTESAAVQNTELSLQGVTDAAVPENTLRQEQLQEANSDQPEKAESLPEFSGHLYFPGNPGLSRVFANSASYTEGDTVNGYRIDQIGEEILVLSRDGEQVRVNLRN